MAIVRYPRCVTGLIALMLAIGLASPALAQQRVGVNSAVNPSATGIWPGTPPRRLVLGQDIVFNERITTGAEGQTQVLFVDQSTMSVGPNADMVIDEFVYDPATGTGKLAANLTRGVFRFVGGKLSKQENAVTMQTPAATIGIRGGVVLVNLAAATPTPTIAPAAASMPATSGKLEVIFVYGKGVTITGVNGDSQTITRPGFQVTVAGRGAAPSEPAPAQPGATAALLAQIDGRPGGNGGASNVPTDTMVANSGIAAAVSSNVTPAQAQQPPKVAAAVQQATTTLQVTANSPVVAQSIAQSISTPPVTPVTPVPAVAPVAPMPAVIPVTPVTPTTAVTPMTPTTPVSPMTPVTPVTPPPTPVVISIAGLAKSTNGPPTVVGFTDQTANGRIPYSNGTITYPPGNVLQNGTAVATIGSLGQVTLSPLTPGSTNPVTATSSTGGTATGTAAMTPDGNFAYADLTSTTSGSSGARLFVFGGVPVSQSFFAANLPAQVTAFQVQPDGALAAGSKAQTIPFLPSNYGGTMPNATVSPLYLVTGANSPFGQANSALNNFVSPKFLQASLAINGQGSSQTSALAITTGNFFVSADTGLVVASGPVRGTVMLNATSPAVHIGSGADTVPDGNGNTLFGGNTLSGFVLDQNQYNSTQNFLPALASAAQFGAATVNYAFNQPVTTTPLPANVPGTQQALNESGYFGGLMTHTTNPTAGSPYVLTGVVSPLQSALTNYRVDATFVGGDPFSAAQSGINSMVLNFGNLGSGPGAGRGTYINNNIFAATDSEKNPSSINENPLPLPSNSPGAPPSPSLAMVTSGTVPNNSWIPAGVTPCSCQYLQWGYWTGQLPSTATQGLGVARTDRAYINTWVAGTPTPLGDINTLAMQGATGSYSGHIIGSVFNDGAQYLAAGGLKATYNFSTQSGSLSVINYDGRFNFTASGVTPLRGASYSFGINNPQGLPITGTANGSFFGPMAAETGGNFAFRTTAGPTYLTSGIFAAKR